MLDRPAARFTAIAVLLLAACAAPVPRSPVPFAQPAGVPPRADSAADSDRGDVALQVSAFASSLLSWPTASDNGGWAAADARALSAPKGLERDPVALVAHLTRGASTDEEKARAIFRWLAENVSYDYAAMKDPKAVPPEQVLASGKSICDGYSSAFEMLGRLAGLEVVTIRGYAKGYDWQPGYHFDKPNHAWNAVRIGGSWRLIDSTWGAGFVKDGQFVKQLEDYFFMPAPEALAYTHLPEDPRWALVPSPLSLAEFEAQPVARASFFRAGFSPADARAAVRSGATATLVQVFRSMALPFRVRSAPAQGVLTAGTSYRFELSGPTSSTLALVNGGRWQYLKGRAGVFSGSLAPRAGEVFLVGRSSGRGGSFETVLHYDVR